MNQALEAEVDFSRSECRPIYNALKVKLVLPLSFLGLLAE